jgi:hypothetical protein
MTIALADVPAEIAVTTSPDPEGPQLDGPLALAGLLLPARGTVTVDLSTAMPGYKTAVYQALYTAQQKGLVACVPAIEVLSDPALCEHLFDEQEATGGHTTVGGQEAMGAIGVDANT